MIRTRAVVWVVAIAAILATVGGSVDLAKPMSARACPANPDVISTFIDDSGRQMEQHVVIGKPAGRPLAAAGVAIPDATMGLKVLDDVPAFDWSYGCGATSAAMLFGYYDRKGYGNIYTGPTNDGVCPLTNSVWGHTTYPSVTCSECPLSATHQGVDGRASKGHVDDYWIDYGDAGPDPYVGNWAEHAYGDCTADFMGTSQSKYGLSDGATYFYTYTNGDPVYDYTGSEPYWIDGCHGMKDFATSRGYVVTANFNQCILGQGSDPDKGFRFEDFMSEIDANRPVVILVEGHAMLGYGYDSASSAVYVHDTWDYSSHQMTWGGSYYGMQHYGVSVVRLASSGLPQPIVVTQAATGISSTCAALNGYLTSLGSATSAQVSFEWGLTTSYGNTTVSVSKTAIGSFSASLTGLAAGTTYHFRAKAVGDGTGYGDDATFATSTEPPSVYTGAATGVSYTSATLNGTLSSLGSATSAEVWFEWGLTTSYGNTTPTVTRTTFGGFTSDVAGLTPDTLYHFRARAVGDGSAHGVDMTFTTSTVAPSASTGAATGVSSRSATLNGCLTSLGLAASAQVSFEWGTTTSYGNTTPTALTTAIGGFSADMTGLKPGTTYHFRAKAVGDGSAYGADVTFVTTPTTITVSTSGLPSEHPATVHYWQDGAAKTETTCGTWSGAVDDGSVVSIDSTVTVSSTERYSTNSQTSWVATQTATCTVAYCHQFKPTISAVMAEPGRTCLSGTNCAILSCQRYGSTETFDVYEGQSFSDWVDAGSTVSLSSLSSASTPTHRWYCPETTSWIISDAGAHSLAYWEQYRVGISSISGLASLEPIAIDFTVEGATKRLDACDAWTGWADSGSTLSVTSLVEGGWIGDWSAEDATEWAVVSPVSASVHYHRSYTGIYILVAAVLVVLTLINMFLLFLRRKGYAVSDVSDYLSDRLGR